MDAARINAESARSNQKRAFAEKIIPRGLHLRAILSAFCAKINRGLARKLEMLRRELEDKKKERENKKRNNKDALHSKSLMWSVPEEKSKDNNWRPAEVNASDILFEYACVCVCVCVCVFTRQTNF